MNIHLAIIPSRSLCNDESGSLTENPSDVTCDDCKIHALQSIKTSDDLQFTTEIACSSDILRSGKQMYVDFALTQQALFDMPWMGVILQNAFYKLLKIADANDMTISKRELLKIAIFTQGTNKRLDATPNG